MMGMRNVVFPTQCRTLPLLLGSLQPSKHAIIQNTFWYAWIGRSQSHEALVCVLIRLTADIWYEGLKAGMMSSWNSVIKDFISRYNWKYELPRMTQNQLIVKLPAPSHSTTMLLNLFDLIFGISIQSTRTLPKSLQLGQIAVKVELKSHIFFFLLSI